MKHHEKEAKLKLETSRFWGTYLEAVLTIPITAKGHGTRCVAVRVKDMNDAFTPSDYQLPAAPSAPVVPDDAPVMSTGATLTGIFFEPGRTFEALRARPRFLVVVGVLTVLSLAFSVMFFQKYGFETVIRAAIEAQPGMDAAQREQAIEFYRGPMGKVIQWVFPLLGVLLVTAAGAGLYLLGTVAMGKTMKFQQALAVWAYSSFPPLVLSTLANLLVLLLKPLDRDELGAVAQRGSLVQASPALLVTASEHPILAALLGGLNVFDIYGLVLAAIGLRIVGKLSAGTAWGIVLFFYLLKVLLTVGKAALTGA